MAAKLPPPLYRRRLLPVLAAVVLLAATRCAAAAPAATGDDAVVVVVSAKSSVTELSRLHLVDLYLGRTTRFENGEPAEPIDQHPQSSVRTAFYEKYLGRSQAEIKAHWSKIVFTGRGRPPKDMPDSEEVKALVAGSPSAVGYIERRLVDESVRIVDVE